MKKISHPWGGYDRLFPEIVHPSPPMTDYFEKQDIMAVSVASKLCVNFYLLLHLNRKKKSKPLAVGKLWRERANCKL
ncbi:hypothetical protein [Hoylesella saccharolytica]|nr:hypothetical protein [Hoylesella saccharolytica]